MLCFFAVLCCAVALERVACRREVEPHLGQVFVTCCIRVGQQCFPFPLRLSHATMLPFAVAALIRQASLSSLFVAEVRSRKTSCVCQIPQATLPHGRLVPLECARFGEMGSHLRVLVHVVVRRPYCRFLFAVSSLIVLHILTYAHGCSDRLLVSREGFVRAFFGAFFESRHCRLVHPSI